jgi:hypothetical protein
VARRYPSSCFWKPVGASPTLHPNSPAIIRNVLAQGAWAAGQKGNEFTAGDWGRPAYTARAGDPAYTMRQDVGTGWRDPFVEGKTFHTRPKARPAGGDDHGFVGFDGDYCFSMWRSHDPVDGHCQLGGVMPTTGDGAAPPHPSNSPYRGVGQAQLGPHMGTVQIAHIRKGRIPHALFMEVRNWHGRCYPSWDADDGKDFQRGGWTPDTNAPAMGQHLWLDYTAAEIDAINAPPFAKVIWKAMAEFGLYVYDNGSAAHALDWEAAHPWLVKGLPNPWIEYANSIGLKPSGGLYYFNVQTGIDWTRLRALPPPPRP